MAVNVMNSGNSSSASTAASSSAVRALALEIKSLQEDPLEGIRSRLVNEDNLFEWEVALFGPPDTLYQGGYFKVIHFFYQKIFNKSREIVLKYSLNNITKSKLSRLCMY